MADSTASGSSSSINPSLSEPSFRQSNARSPTSAGLGSPSAPSTIGGPSTPATNATRMPMRKNPGVAAYTPNKRIIIRADPTLVSCFDPADKELYELWAPKP